MKTRMRAFLIFAGIIVSQMLGGRVLADALPRISNLETPIMYQVHGVISDGAQVIDSFDIEVPVDAEFNVNTGTEVPYLKTQSDGSSGKVTKEFGTVHPGLKASGKVHLLQDGQLLLSVQVTYAKIAHWERFSAAGGFRSMEAPAVTLSSLNPSAHIGLGTPVRLFSANNLTGTFTVSRAPDHSVAAEVATEMAHVIAQEMAQSIGAARWMIPEIPTETNPVAQK